MYPTQSIAAIFVKRNCEGITMTEQQIKELCKWAIDNGNRSLSDLEKELAKKAIEESKSIEELISTVLSIVQVG